MTQHESTGRNTFRTGSIVPVCAAGACSRPHACCCFSCLAVAHAQVSPATATSRWASRPNEKSPTVLDKVGIAAAPEPAASAGSRPSSTTPASRCSWASYFGGKHPAILALVYYQCPMLCSEELNGLTGALQMVSYQPGKDFKIVVVSASIPAKAPELAAPKKRSYVKRYGHPETADGWHFLTGTAAEHRRADQGGRLRLRQDPRPGWQADQFAHASSIQIVTPEGKLAQYYMGVEYSPQGHAAGPGRGLRITNRLAGRQHSDLLLPLRSDTNKHSLIVARVVQLGGMVTVLIAGRIHVGDVPPGYHEQPGNRSSNIQRSAWTIKEQKVNG